jgi:c-di-GMP-related signal transduction protein
MPIEEILGSIEVEPDIRAALLEHSGPLGTLLQTAEWIDGQMSHGILPTTLSARLVQAMAWANSIAQESAIDAEAN